MMPAMPCKVCISIKSPSIPRVNNRPLMTGSVAKRASISPKEYDCVTSGAPASFSWTSAAFKSGAVPSATPARTASSD